jgi:hypothetical protein
MIAFKIWPFLFVVCCFTPTNEWQACAFKKESKQVFEMK